MVDARVIIKWQTHCDNKCNSKVAFTARHISLPNTRCGFYGVSRWCARALYNLLWILLNCLRAAPKFNWSINNPAHRMCLWIWPGRTNMVIYERWYIFFWLDRTVKFSWIDFTVSHFICLTKINNSQTLRYLIHSRSSAVVECHQHLTIEPHTHIERECNIIYGIAWPTFSTH